MVSTYMESPWKAIFFFCFFYWGFSIECCHCSKYSSTNFFRISFSLGAHFKNASNSEISLVNILVFVHDTHTSYYFLNRVQLTYNTYLIFLKIGPFGIFLNCLFFTWYEIFSKSVFWMVEWYSILQIFNKLFISPMLDIKLVSNFSQLWTMIQ